MFFESFTSTARKGDEDAFDVYGYHFSWSPLHKTAEELRPMKFSYDRLADDVLQRLEELGEIRPRNTSETKEKSRSASPADLFGAIKRVAEQGEDDTINKFWEEINTIPSWVDWKQIDRGQRVFYRYAGPALIGLAFSGLLGGMAAPGVVETLARTGGFGPKIAKKRMLETFQHTMDVTASLDSIKPGGEGHLASVRVRLLHSFVRRRILALRKTRPSYYDLEQHGIPINDHDCIATILTFSTKLLLLSLPAQGIFLHPDEVEDYTAVWRLVAHLMGTPTDPFSTPALAKAYMDSILLANLNPSQTGKILANNIIASLAGEGPHFASADFLRAEAWWISGPKLCKALNIPKPSLLANTLVAVQVMFWATWCYISRSRQKWDENRVKTLRYRFRQIFVEGKYGVKGVTGEIAMFNFQYIPEYTTVTDISLAPKDEKSLLTPHRMERTMVIVLLFFLGLSAIFWFCLYRAAMWFARRI